MKVMRMASCPIREGYDKSLQLGPDEDEERMIIRSKEEDQAKAEEEAAKKKKEAVRGGPVAEEGARMLRR